MVTRVTGPETEPELVRDAFWENDVPEDRLPHAAAGLFTTDNIEPSSPHDVRSLDGGVDGPLAGMPTSKASWMEVEARAWAARQQRRPTFRK
jgi:hypothetical protein